MSNTILSFPIPAYANVPIQADFYQPNRFVLSSISLGDTTTITTTEDVNYVLGQLVRLIIPPQFGTRTLNERQGYVIAIPSSTQVTLDIDSKGMDAFINATARTKAQILAIGDINSGPINMGRNNNTTYIQGSFINISPN